MWMNELVYELAARPLLLDLLWQSTVATVLGLIAARLWRRDPDFAHAALAIGLCAAVLTPVLSMIVRGVGLGWLSPAERTELAAASLPQTDSVLTATASSATAPKVAR